MKRAVEVAVAAGVEPLDAARAATSVPRSALGRAAPAIEVGTRLDALNRVDPWLRGPE